MSYATGKPNKRVTLPSDANYWVELGTEFTYGDIKNIGGDVSGVEATDKFLQIAIKAWNLDGEDGNVLEITPDNIDVLKQEDVVALVDALNEEVATAASKKDGSTN